VLLNRGDGTLRDAVVYAAPTPQGLAVADLTGDGILDLVTVAPGGNLLSVFPGRSDGSFGTRINHLAGQDPVALAIAGIDCDGHPDVVVANQRIAAITVLAARCQR
jgi:hypothetical protein